MIDIPDFVYPKDPNGNALCPRCNKLVTQCDCPVIEPVKLKPCPVRPSVRIDRSGRKGKIVTLIEDLPHDRAYLEDLAKILKGRTGSGGTFYMADSSGTIELQGDHKKFVVEYFRKQ